MDASLRPSGTVGAPRTTDRELARYWSERLTTDAYDDPTLWFTVLDVAGTTPGPCSRVTGVPARPDDLGPYRLAQLLSHLVHGDPARPGPPVGAAVLLSRPGSTRLRVGDRAWADGLGRACHHWQVPLLGVHLAAAGRVRPLPADDARSQPGG